MSSDATPPETSRPHILSMIFTLGWVGTVIVDPHFSRHLLVIGERGDSGDFTTWRGTEAHHDTRPTPADRAAVATIVRGVADEIEGSDGAAGGRSSGGRGSESASSDATRATLGGVVTDTTIRTSDWQAVIATNAKHASHLFLIGDPPEPPDPYGEDDEDEEDEPTVRPFRRATPADRVAAAAVLRALAEEIDAAA
jgi:hypothetical protein